MVSQVTDQLHHHLAVYLVVPADFPYELHFFEISLSPASEDGNQVAWGCMLIVVGEACGGMCCVSTGRGVPSGKNRTGYEGTSGNYLQDLVTALAVVASAPNVEVKRFSLNPTDPYLSDVV